MKKTECQIINRSKNPLPDYQTKGAAAVDLMANVLVPKIIKPMERLLVPTGIYIALPQGYEAQVRPRSGLAMKFGITVLNSPGTIDSDYRGEIGVVLINLSNKDFKISNGDFIITMDADLQDDPSEIKNLIAKLDEGWDVVSGWKKTRLDPLNKRVPSKLFNFITRLFTGVKIHDFN